MAEEYDDEPVQEQAQAQAQEEQTEQAEQAAAAAQIVNIVSRQAPSALERAQLWLVHCDSREMLCSTAGHARRSSSGHNSSEGRARGVLAARTA